MDRREEEEQITDRIHLDRVRSLLRTAYWSRRFREHLAEHGHSISLHTPTMSARNIGPGASPSGTIVPKIVLDPIDTYNLSVPDQDLVSDSGLPSPRTPTTSGRESPFQQIAKKSAAGLERALTISPFRTRTPSDRGLSSIITDGDRDTYQQEPEHEDDAEDFEGFSKVMAAASISRSTSMSASIPGMRPARTGSFTSASAHSRKQSIESDIGLQRPSDAAQTSPTR